MSFGSLKTIKLERTLGNDVLSITTHIPIDSDEVEAFGALDESIIKSVNNLIKFEGEEVKEAEVKRGYPATKVDPVEPKQAEAKEEKPKSNGKPEPKKKGRGRPKGSTAKPKEDVPPVIEEKKSLKPVTKDLASQEDKVSLVQLFQATFEEEIGYESDDTYEKEFSAFLESLISMDFKSFLEADVTTAQLKTFKELI